MCHAARRSRGLVKPVPAAQRGAGRTRFDGKTDSKRPGGVFG
jgi:hypothetical protein